MNFFIYPSMSTQAVWIRSLTSLPLFIAFLKHSYNLSSVKGDPHLQKKKTDKQTVTDTGRKNGFTRVAKLQQMCSKYHICTILRKSKD